MITCNFPFKIKIEQSTKTSYESLKNLRKESPPLKTEEKAKEDKEVIGANLSEEEKNKLCEKLDALLAKLTDFDIKVSQLRTDFMNYTKKFLNHHYSIDKPEKKEEMTKEKDDYLVSYSEKINDLNQLLQKYKLEIYVLKNKEQCPSKIKIILNEVQTNFLNLITIIKDEIKESKIPLSFIMINFQEKEDLENKASDANNRLKELMNKNQKEEMEDKGNVII